MLIKKSERKKHENAPTCIAYEYKHEDKDIDVAFIEINGRYPERGRCVNRVCKEVVFISSGAGKIEIEGKTFEVEEGDAVIIRPNQKYFFEGNLETIVCCTPSWNLEQYEYCD